MRTPLALALIAVLLSVASPASAQLTEKEAVKQVKDSSKSQVKAFKQNAAAALGTLDANLKTVEDLITESSDAAVLMSQIANMGQEYMESLNEAFAGAKSLVDSAAALALDALADGGDLQGLFPEELHYGSGGVLDKNLAALVKAGMKSRDAAVKRIAKANAKAEKEANIAITFELRFPTRTEVFAIAQGGLLSLAQTTTIDVIFGASDLDAAADGVLFFAGETDDDGDVTVDYFNATGGFDSATSAPSPGTLRFAGFFTGLEEGGYVVDAKQGTDSTFHSVGEIGIR